MRLRSGAEVGFIAPFWPESSSIAILTTGRERAAEDVLEELIECTGLERRQVTALRPATNGSGGRYRTTPIHPEFVGEHLPGNRRWNGSQVTYLDEQERKPYRLHMRAGRLYDSRDQLFDTAGARTLWTPQGGRAIFVMGADGVLYSSPHHILGRFHIRVSWPERRAPEQVSWPRRSGSSGSSPITAPTTGRRGISPLRWSTASAGRASPSTISRWNTTGPKITGRHRGNRIDSAALEPNPFPTCLGGWRPVGKKGPHHRGWHNAARGRRSHTEVRCRVDGGSPTGLRARA